MQLNEEQMKAVTHPLGAPACLIAGAGSGKTRVMTERVGWLIKQGVSPRRICAITFTNRAAKEILERLNLDPDSHDVPHVSTIHSLALASIRKSPVGFGLKEKVTPLDDYDQTQMVRKIIDREIDLKKDGEVNPYKFLEKIGFHRARGVGFAVDYTEEVSDRAQVEHAGYHALEPVEVKLWEKFEVEKRTTNTIDFDDMLCYFNRRCEQDPVWLSKLHKMFDVVLVDEAQDLSIPQWGVVNGLLAPDNPNLMTVGDLNQSVMGFNGSAPWMLKKFSEEWREKNPTLYKIARNHRSLPNIIRLANKVNKTMTETIPLNMSLWRGVDEEGKPIEGQQGGLKFIKASTPAEVALTIAAEINRDNQVGAIPFKENCVLVRSAMQVRDLEGAFVKYRIPYIVRGGRGLLQTEEIRDILSYLRLITNPKDFTALSRAIGVPKRGVGETSLEKIRSVANEKYDGDLIKGCNSIEKLSLFVQELTDIQRFVGHPVQALEKILLFTDYKKFITKKYEKDKEKAQTKLENIGRFLELVRSLNEEQEMSTEDLVFQLTLDRAREDDKEGMVTISTIHCVDPSTMVGVPNKGLQTLAVASQCIPSAIATLRKPAVATERIEHPAQPCLRITTRFGFSLIGAHHHHLLKEDLVTYAPLKDIKVGDTLPIRLGINCGNSQEPSNRDIMMGELLGLLVGGGSYNDPEEGVVQLACGDKDVFGYFCAIVKSLFGTEVSIADYSDTRQCGYFCRKAAREELLLLGLGYLIEDKKEIPSSIFSSHPKVQAAFIRGLFEADGSVSEKGAGVRFVNTAPKVIDGVHLILANLGILSCSRLVRGSEYVYSDGRDRKAVYTVSITGVDAAVYYNLVGFISGRKRIRLARVSAKVKGKTNIDYLPLPLAKSIVKDIYVCLKQRGLSLFAMKGKIQESIIRNAMYHKHGLSVRGAKALLPFLESFGDSEFTPMVNLLHKYTDERIFFDVVEKVEEVEPRPLLDVSVPETHSYWTNGFISHNSSKGLEWSRVFLTNVTEGSLPHRFSIGSESEIEEEKRLLYVACTRARDSLTLCVHSMESNPSGSGYRAVKPSRFLGEIGI